MGEKHLSMNELGERLGVPYETVKKWNSRGTGPRYMQIGRHVRYRLADVIAWENARAAAVDQRRNAKQKTAAG